MPPVLQFMLYSVQQWFNEHNCLCRMPENLGGNWARRLISIGRNYCKRRYLYAFHPSEVISFLSISGFMLSWIHDYVYNTLTFWVKTLMSSNKHQRNWIIWTVSMSEKKENQRSIKNCEKVWQLKFWCAIHCFVCF